MYHNVSTFCDEYVRISAMCMLSPFIVMIIMVVVLFVSRGVKSSQHLSLFSSSTFYSTLPSTKIHSSFSRLSSLRCPYQEFVALFSLHVTIRSQRLNKTSVNYRVLEVGFSPCVVKKRTTSLISISIFSFFFHCLQ